MYKFHPMLEEFIVRHCSPTLAGIKTGNISTVPYEDLGQFWEEIRCLNMRLVPKGMRLVPLKFFDCKVLVYIYRPEYLEADLSVDLACELMQSRGYTCGNAGLCVKKLAMRLKENDGFPHEIGLFLSYPPADVDGFIKYKAKNFILAGDWKVYSDVENAVKKFDAYRRCKAIYHMLWDRGMHMDYLAIGI